MRALWSSIVHTIVLWYISSSICSPGYAAKFQNETDRLALLAFKDAMTLDPHGVLNSWNNSLHYCDWQGVSCSSKHRQRVSILDLSSQGLVGPITPQIGNLSFLRIIFLQNNSFHGEIPLEIGQLFRLRLLYLNNNSFHGEVPTNLTGCFNLRQLNLIDNKLAGKIPVELSSLPWLAALGLGQNNFGGKIPPSLGNFSSLVLLSLTEARLEGSIPEDLGRLSRLEYLIMANNKLSGTIPSGIYNLSSLTLLSVARNQLQGKLPADIGFTLPNLKQLALGLNQFTGPIPDSLSNASQLQLISFFDNMFSGPVPGGLGRLVNLSLIGLSGNMLGTRDGNDLSFMSYLTNCTRLERLFIGGNFLKGSLPNSIANLSTQIRYLSIGINQIYGIIPAGIGNLVNLNLLDMQYIMLSGNIPAGIGNLQKLLRLYFPGNKLTGQIPSSLGNLTELYDLHLEKNQLSGKLPPSLGNCQKLQILDLSQNDLNGQISTSVFSLPSLLSINLSHNAFTGSLPSDVGNLKQLENLDVSGNKLSGGIPNTLDSCLSLAYLHMEGNSFGGTIPHALKTLRGIDVLDLSRNNLTGPIPKYLGELPFLNNLNLSFNKLEGEVPQIGIFRNASVISVIGNPKLCGGIPELKLPTCTVLDSDKKGMPPALKAISVVTAVAAVCLILLACFFLRRYQKNKPRKNLSSTSFNHQFMRISYGELVKATDGLSEANLIGVGSYGSVYKGILDHNETVIAVKVLNLHRRGASKSFISECKALKNVRHWNLLKIISACSSVDFQGNDFRALIYEFMPKGSLENWLHPVEVVDGENESRTLNLMQRLKIAIDVASALEYLHCHCPATIVHGDLKPSNVLLDDNMVAHVGDFGLAKVLSMVTSSSEDNQTSSAMIKGSIGYVAPEYGVGGEMSIYGDAYSYGILLLELFTGKRPTDDLFKEGLNLHNFSKMAMTERVMEIVDPHMLLEEDTIGRMHECLVSVLSVGISCSLETPTDRMDIRDAVRKLHLVKAVYEGEGTHGQRLEGN